MTCAEANTIGLVEYLSSLGFSPTKLRSNDYWYLSPLRNEKEASFKINKTKNVWYDHGAGKGGSVIDFTMQYFNCDLHEAMQKISLHLKFPANKISSIITSPGTDLSNTNKSDLFTSPTQQIDSLNEIKNNEGRPPFHLHENSLINHTNAAETAIQIIAAKKPITDPMLCRYLKERRIDKSIADIYCHEVKFKLTNKEKEYTAVGFKNSAGGYELRNSFFKLSSSPKYVTYINNFRKNCNNNAGEKSIGDVLVTGQKRPVKTLKNSDENKSKKDFNQHQIEPVKNTEKNIENFIFTNHNQSSNELLKQIKSIAVFEGFFDFLTHQTIHQNQQ